MARKANIFIVCCILAAIVASAVRARATVLTGTVSDSDSKPLSSAYVTARNLDKGMAITVLSDSRGQYHIRDLFPGHYELSVRRVGYGTVKLKDFTLTETDAGRDFQVHATSDIADQMPPGAWLTVLPTGEYKADLMGGCAVCHAFGSAPTRKPRSRDEWVKVIKWMRGIGEAYSVIPSFDDQKFAGWLANNGFGPDAKVPKFHPPALPTGDAAGAIYTEYDIGGPATWTHDMAVDPTTGAAWVSDYSGGKLYRVDPRSGAQKVYSIPIRGEGGTGGHTLRFDRDGALWITVLLADAVLKFDPRTETFRTYKGFTKGSLPHSFACDPFGFVRYDTHGRLWLSEFAGNAVVSLDPRSGEVHEYNNAPHPGGHPYGIATDSLGRIWFSKYSSNVLDMLDPETGLITEHEMPRKNSFPHRMVADAHDRLWIAESGYGALAMYNIRNGTFSEYELPDPGVHAYSAELDGRGGAVWITSNGSDAVYRFNPATRTFTTFRLPTAVSFTRVLSFDYGNGDIWTSLSNFPNKHTGRNCGELVRIHMPQP